MTTVTDHPAAPLALVTGASSGIGRSLVQQFVEHGYDVIAAAEDPGIAELVTEDGRIRPIQVDLATAEGVTELHRVAQAEGRPLDAAALNAGVGVGGRFDQTDLDADLNLVDLNVRSTVHLAKLVSRDMVAAGRGRILFTASIAATAPGPYHATYAASKAFVHSFAEGLRVELEPEGISVTSLMPGPTDTEFFERADMQDTAIGAGEKDDPDAVARDGFEALMAGKPHVVAGSFSNKIQATTATHLPDQVTSKKQAKMTKPGSGR
ncbi:MAG: oxidoreductase [Marmoricola sp.]|nr:oxidoreductase [Marmoricola sp.]